jgi:hypothetical protein
VDVPRRRGRLAVAGFAVAGFAVAGLAVAGRSGILLTWILLTWILLSAVRLPGVRLPGERLAGKLLTGKLLGARRTLAGAALETGRARGIREATRTVARVPGGLAVARVRARSAGKGARGTWVRTGASRVGAGTALRRACVRGVCAGSARVRAGIPRVGTGTARVGTACARLAVAGNLAVAGKGAVSRAALARGIGLIARVGARPGEAVARRKRSLPVSLSLSLSLGWVRRVAGRRPVAGLGALAAAGGLRTLAVVFRVAGVDQASRCEDGRRCQHAVRVVVAATGPLAGIFSSTASEQRRHLPTARSRVGRRTGPGPAGTGLAGRDRAAGDLAGGRELSRLAITVGWHQLP